MLCYDPTTASCSVLTYKHGLLAKVAHDLELEVTRFEIRVDETRQRIEASFDSASLRVVDAVQAGARDPAALKPADKRKIEDLIRSEVLRNAEFPEVRFASHEVALRHDGGYDIAGTLTLHGVSKALTLRSECAGGRQSARVVVQQPEFGIKPYSAMMGALKIRPDVVVVVRV